MVLPVSAPACLKKPLFVSKKLLMGPGPSNCSSRVLESCSQQLLGHLDQDFLNVLDEVKEGIQYAFQTANKLTFAISGTGHCAMETAICNVVESGEHFLVASAGIWGDRAMDMGRRIGAICHQITIAVEEVIQLTALKEIVEHFKPTVAYLCHGDSSTGTLQPLEEILNYFHNLNCITIVDCVASLGASPIFMDRWGIDVLYSGSQKILSAPPGLSPISFSSKAVQKIKSRKTPVKSFYMDVLLIGKHWRCYDKTIFYHHTIPVNLIYALREALAILVEETLEKCWERHLTCAQKLWRNLEDMGLTLLIPEKACRLPSVTTVQIPAYCQGAEVIQCMRQRYAIDIAGGLGSTAGRVWRIGLMGNNCTEQNVALVSEALHKCINSCLKSTL